MREWRGREKERKNKKNKEVGGELRRDGWLDKVGEEGWGYFLLATAKFAIFF